MGQMMKRKCIYYVANSACLGLVWGTRAAVAMFCALEHQHTLSAHYTFTILDNTINGLEPKL